MAPETRTLITEALALDPDQRAVLVNALLESLHPVSGAEDVRESWLAEAALRLTAVRDGTSTAVDADDHYARLRSSIAG